MSPQAAFVASGLLVKVLEKSRSSGSEVFAGKNSAPAYAGITPERKDT